MIKSPGVLLIGSLIIAGICFMPSQAIAEEPRDNACPYVCNATDHATFVDGIIDPIRLVIAVVAEFRTRGFFNACACNVLRRVTTTGTPGYYLGLMVACFVILNRVARRRRAVTANETQVTQVTTDSLQEAASANMRMKAVAAPSYLRTLVFRRRMGRAEFTIITVVSGFASGVSSHLGRTGSGWAAFLFGLVTFIFGALVPCVTWARRVQDIGFPGWIGALVWGSIIVSQIVLVQLDLAAVPSPEILVVCLALVILMVKRGTIGANRYGDEPRAACARVSPISAAPGHGENNEMSESKDARVLYSSALDVTSEGLGLEVVSRVEILLDGIRVAGRAMRPRAERIHFWALCVVFLVAAAAGMFFYALESVHLPDPDSSVRNPLFELLAPWLFFFIAFLAVFALGNAVVSWLFLEKKERLVFVRTEQITDFKIGRPDANNCVKVRVACVTEKGENAEVALGVRSPKGTFRVDTKKLDELRDLLVSFVSARKGKAENDGDPGATAPSARNLKRADGSDETTSNADLVELLVQGKWEALYRASTIRVTAVPGDLLALVTRRLSCCFTSPPQDLWEGDAWKDATGSWKNLDSGPLEVLLSDIPTPPPAEQRFLLLLRAIWFEGRGDIKSGHETVVLGTSEYPTCGEFWFLRGVGAGDPREKLEALAKAVRYSPHYAQGHLWYGLELAKRGELEQALTSAQRLVQLGPSWPTAYVFLAGVLWHLGKVDEAKAIYRSLVTLAPGTDHGRLAQACIEGTGAPRPFREPPPPMIGHGTAMAIAVASIFLLGGPLTRGNPVSSIGIGVIVYGLCNLCNRIASRVSAKSS